MVDNACYEQMVQTIEGQTGMVTRAKVPGLGHQGWALTGPAGATAVVLLKGCSFKPARKRWFSGVGTHQVEALAGCHGFTVVGLCDAKGARLVHVLVIPGRVVQAWAASAPAPVGTDWGASMVCVLTPMWTRITCWPSPAGIHQGAARCRPFGRPRKPRSCPGRGTRILPGRDVNPAPPSPLESPCLMPGGAATDRQLSALGASAV
jgi:hypothetical protein